MIQNTNKGDWDPERPTQILVSGLLCAHLSISKGKNDFISKIDYTYGTVTISPLNSKQLNS
jgi:hypothetical protein